MTSFTAANLQYTATAHEKDTLAIIKTLMEEARGAELVCLPECATRMDPDKSRLAASADLEADSSSLKMLQSLAREYGCYLSVGSIILRHDAPKKTSPENSDAEKIGTAKSGKLANRSFLITPNGEIAARYDKLHMFDADVGDGRRYHESALYAAGDAAVLVTTDLAAMGMTICYDLRFPHLYQALGQAGAEVMLVPSAFTKTSGEAHWHSLLRARAIETGSYVIAAAQTGTHDANPDPEHAGEAPRQTYGHSLIVSPWGEVLSDGGDEPGVTTATIDTAAVTRARQSIPAITTARAFALTTLSGEVLSK